MSVSFKNVSVRFTGVFFIFLQDCARLWMESESKISVSGLVLRVCDSDHPHHHPEENGQVFL